MAHVTAVLEQSRYLWLNDDGNISTATDRAAESVGDIADGGLTFVSADLDANVRLRLRVRETAGGDPGGASVQLEYNRNTAGWNPVNASSIVARSSASGNVTDGQATVDDQITGGAGSGAFLAGSFDEVDGLTASINMVENDWTDVEYCIQLREVDLSNGDTVDFRVTSSGTPLNTYTDAETPRAAISLAAAASPIPTILRPPVHRFTKRRA